MRPPLPVVFVAAALALLFAGCTVGAGPEPRVAQVAPAVPAVPAASTPSAQPKPGPAIRINEICPLPETDGGPVWVELHNSGGAPTSAGDWSLADAAEVYALPADTPPVPPGGVLLLVFGPEGGTVRGLGSDAGPTIRVTDRPAFLRGKSNELGLYSAAQPSAEALVDFTYWGKPGGTQQAGWAQGAGLDASRHFSADGAPGEQLLFPGAAIGRPNQAWTDEQGVTHARAYWALYVKGVATPGLPNPIPAPVPMEPWGGSRTCVGGSSFTAIWYGQPGGVTGPYDTRYQVATDPDFRHLVVDVAARGPYGHRPPLPAGDYYWRARCEYKGLITPWTEVIAYHENKPEPETKPQVPSPPPSFTVPVP